jgi:myxalamid-type polyketide synthase MxaE and MxaD
MQRALGALYTRGVAVDWSAVYPTGAFLPDAPTYPFQRERHWFEPVAVAPATPAGLPAGSHPLLGRHAALAHPPGAHVWEVDWRGGAGVLAGHTIQGAAVVPGAAYVEMAAAAGAEVFADAATEVLEVQFHKVLVLPPQGARTVQTVVALESDHAATVRIFSRPAAPTAREVAWTLHASGKVARVRQGAATG